MPAPRMTIDDLPEDTTVGGGEMLVVSDAGSSKKLMLSRITDIPAAALAAHLADTTDVHAATAISATAGTVLTGTDVQNQLSAADTAISGNTTAINDNAAALSSHLSDAADAHDASAISTTLIASVTGTDVQTVLAELAARIVALETPAP